MQNILDWGLDVIRAIQGHPSPFLVLVMKGISLTGSTEFYIACLPLLYWCVNRRKSLDLGIVVLVSAFINVWLKEVFMLPRPYQIDPSVGLDTALSWALPSGHAQGTAVFWGMIALLFHRRLFAILAFVLPLLVGLSRVWLGVHYPSDVVAGWVLAAFLVSGWMIFSGRSRSLLGSLDARFRYIIVAAVSWIMNALLPGDTMIAGAFLGAGAGFIYSRENLQFDSGGSLRTRILRYLVGISIALVIYLVPKLLLGDAFPDQERLIRFLRYAVLGAWIALGAPLLFVRLGLAKVESGINGESGGESAV